MLLIPPIGSKGIFTLRAPFNNDLLENVVYSCESVRRLSDIIEDGDDPFELYYNPKGLTEEEYNIDLVANVPIVSLRTGQNRWVRVPATYVESYANSGGVPYTVLGLGLNLGPMPNSQDLSSLIQKIKDLVRDNIGVVPEVKTLAISEQQQISHQDHESLLAVRQALITDSTTDRAKLIEAIASRDALAARNQVLEQYILDNQ